MSDATVEPYADRDYIADFVADFKSRTGKTIEYVDTASRRIMLDGLSDEDAQFVAKEFARMKFEAQTSKIGNDADQP